MEPVPTAAVIEPVKVHTSTERVDTKKMVEWHGKIMSFRDDNSRLEKKIADLQKDIDKISAKLGDTTHIKDDKANHLLEQKLVYLEEQKKARETIVGHKAEKEELKAKLEAERERKSKEVEEDLVEVSKAMDTGKAELAENEKKLKDLEGDAGQVVDPKKLKEVRESIKKQNQSVLACKKEIAELEHRRHTLIMESYAFGKKLNVRFFDFFDPPLKGKSVRPHYKDAVKNDQEEYNVHCWIDHPKKDVIYIPYAKTLKKMKCVKLWDDGLKQHIGKWVNVGDTLIKFRAVPGVSVQNCSNLEFSLKYTDLKLTADKVHFCWNYHASQKPED